MGKINMNTYIEMLHRKMNLKNYGAAGSSDIFTFDTNNYLTKCGKKKIIKQTDKHHREKQKINK